MRPELLDSFAAVGGLAYQKHVRLDSGPPQCCDPFAYDGMVSQPQGFEFERYRYSWRCLSIHASIFDSVILQTTDALNDLTVPSTSLASPRPGPSEKMPTHTEPSGPRATLHYPRCPLSAFKPLIVLGKTLVRI